jgi:hypothetical protein
MSFRSKVTVAGLIVLSAACNTEAGTPLGPDTITEPALNANVGGSKSQPGDLLLLPAAVEIRGSASLTRLPNGITTHVNVDPGVIPEGDVITLWGVIFNDPSECTAGTPGVSACDPPDLGNSLANPSLVWLGSGIASGGSTRYTGHIMVGDASGDILDLFGLPSGPGLLNPAGAEIHVVVRTHGQPISGQLQSQRKTFAGGCDVNACADLLGVRFPVAAP